MTCPICGRRTGWARPRCPACGAKLISWYILAAIAVLAACYGAFVILESIA